MFQQALLEKAGGPPCGMVALELAPSAASADRLLDAWAARLREHNQGLTQNEAKARTIAEARTALAWDFLFIACYGFVLFVLAAGLAEPLGRAWAALGTAVALLQLLAAVFDMLENFGLLGLLAGVVAVGPMAELDWMAQLSRSFARAKFSLLAFGVCWLLLCLLGLLIKSAGAIWSAIHGKAAPGDTGAKQASQDLGAPLPATHAEEASPRTGDQPDAICFTAGFGGAAFGAGAIHAYLSADRNPPAVAAGVSLGAVTAAAMRSSYHDLLTARRDHRQGADLESRRFAFFRRYIEALGDRPLNVITESIPDPIDFLSNLPPVRDPTLKPSEQSSESAALRHKQLLALL